MHVIEIAIEKLKIAKSSLEEQLIGVNKAIHSLENWSNSDSVVDNLKGAIESYSRSHPNSEYRKDWSIVNKFLFIKKREGRFLHFREVANLIIEIEGEGDPTALSKSLTVSTYALKKSGEIVKFEPASGKRYTFWGDPKWLDENENVIKGHEINPDYLLPASKRPNL